MSKFRIGDRIKWRGGEDYGGILEYDATYTVRGIGEMDVWIGTLDEQGEPFDGFDPEDFTLANETLCKCKKCVDSRQPKKAPKKKPKRKARRAR